MLYSYIYLEYVIAIYKRDYVLFPYIYLEHVVVIYKRDYVLFPYIYLEHVVAIYKRDYVLPIFTLNMWLQSISETMCYFPIVPTHGIIVLKLLLVSHVYQ